MLACSSRLMVRHIALSTTGLSHHLSIACVVVFSFNHLWCVVYGINASNGVFIHFEQQILI